MVSSRSLLLAGGLKQAFKGIVVFLSIMSPYTCSCGYVFGNHIRRTTVNHLKGLRHTMYSNGATENQYKTYMSSQGLLRQKCKGRSTNRVGDHNWNCYNSEIQGIVNDMVKILDKYLHNHPKYKEMKDTIEACYIKTD